LQAQKHQAGQSAIFPARQCCQCQIKKRMASYLRWFEC